MNQAKHNILSRLKTSKSIETHLKKVDTFSSAAQTTTRCKKPIEQLAERLVENHADIHYVDNNNWQHTFIRILEDTKASHCLLGQSLTYQEEIRQTLAVHKPDLKVTRYDQAYEDLRRKLFHDIDISLTMAHAAIAETGTLVLIPDENEPRMMSLAPPIHVVLLDTGHVFKNMGDFLHNAPWYNEHNTDALMPSNVLFISSPSKTADIQQTLAYGAHGPKRLIVLLKR